MAFSPDATKIARAALAESAPHLASKFAGIVDFLSAHPDAASALRGKTAPAIGSADYIHRQAEAFVQARKARAPSPPATIPDEMVSVILVSYFKIAPDSTERVKEEHALSMAAENFIGELLERYLASVMEAHGWIWCSGAMVKAVDFIKPPSQVGDEWRLLQVKNRDNSENSSSSAIRLGTSIEKWHRSFSKRPESNWPNFPDTTLRDTLSEENFKAFVQSYLQQLPG